MLALSPVAAAPASAKKRDAKPPRSGKKSKRARTPRRATKTKKRDENEKAEMKSRAEDGTRSVEGEDEDGPSPPAADFEAMLASAIAAADGGDVDAVLGGASSKVMNSPAPARRETRERPVRTRAAGGEAFGGDADAGHDATQRARHELQTKLRGENPESGGERSREHAHVEREATRDADASLAREEIG